MTNRLAVERQRLYNALEAVLPGRVHPYPPPTGVKAAPGIWIGQPTVLRTTIGRATRASAVFPITLAYDGADRAQVAGLDDLVSNTWDALAGLERVEPDAARPEPLNTDPDDRQIRATVLAADVTIAARTLCLPDVEQVAIPPTLIQEAANG